MARAPDDVDAEQAWSGGCAPVGSRFFQLMPGDDEQHPQSDEPAELDDCDAARQRQLRSSIATRRCERSVRHSVRVMTVQASIAPASTRHRAAAILRYLEVTGLP